VEASENAEGLSACLPFYGELRSTAASETRARRFFVSNWVELGALVIGWGRRDRVCLPSQSKLALEKFPDACLHWFEHCGHFPQWDKPQETVRLVLEGTSQDKIAETTRTTENTMGAWANNLRFQQ